MIFIDQTVELYLHIIKIVCVKIEQQEGNQMIHIFSILCQFLSI